MNNTFNTHFITVLVIGMIVSGIEYTNSALTGLLLLALSSLTLLAVTSKREWNTSPLSYVMISYLTWLIIVVTVSKVPNTSLLTAWILAGLPITYLAWTNIANAHVIWARLRMFFWLSGVGMAGWAIWQVIHHIGNGQAVGPLVDRNAFAALTNLLWFPAAYLFLASKTNPKGWLTLLYGVGLFIMSAGLFATESRGGIATWLLLLPILLWAGYRYSPAKRLVWLIPLIALAGYLASTQLAGTNIANRTYDLAHDASTSSRLLIWKSTFQMIFAHPFFGSGWGTFTNYYPAHRSLAENTTSGLFAHNDYLQLAAEGGVPALLLLGILVLAILFLLKQSLTRASNIAGLESTALLLGSLALFIHASVNFIFYFAFLNIVAGLFIGRATQLSGWIKLKQLPSIKQISRPIRYLLATFITLFLAAPLLIHLIAQYSLIGSQPGLKAINVISPQISAYDIAKLISAIRPQEGIAQEGMLEISETWLQKNKDINDDSFIKHELINETLRRFDFIRAQTANNPDIGVREIRVLLNNHKSIGDKIAYKKAHHVLRDNLAANPYHANSIIELAYLQQAEGHRIDALNTLQQAQHHVLTHRDQLLIKIELLHLLIYPKNIQQLVIFKNELNEVRPETEHLLPPNFYNDIDAKLNLIAASVVGTHP